MIYLVRHGETEWNRIGRKQGRGDSPLTDVGVRQVKACGELLRQLLAEDLPVDICSSPLGRAKLTAELIANELGIQSTRIRVDDRLAEHHYGFWEGLVDSEIDAQFPGERERREQNKWNYVVPGGESYSLLADRVRPWVQEQKRTATTVVVAHDMVSRVVRGICLDLLRSQTLLLAHPHNCIYELSRGVVFAHEAILK